MPELSKARAAGALRPVSVVTDVVAPGVNLLTAVAPEFATKRLPELSKTRARGCTRPLRTSRDAVVAPGANLLTVVPFPVVP